MSQSRILAAVKYILEKFWLFRSDKTVPKNVTSRRLFVLLSYEEKPHGSAFKSATKLNKELWVDSKFSMLRA